MIGVRQLLNIAARFKEMFPASDQPFGGKHIYLFGDHLLPPVCDTPLHRFDQADSKIQLGITLFRTFQKFVELTTAHRQSDDNEYAALLERLAHGQLTDAITTGS